MAAPVTVEIVTVVVAAPYLYGVAATVGGVTGEPAECNGLEDGGLSVVVVTHGVVAKVVEQAGRGDAHGGHVGAEAAELLAHRGPGDAADVVVAVPLAGVLVDVGGRVAVGE